MYDTNLSLFLMFINACDKSTAERPQCKSLMKNGLVIYLSLCIETGREATCATEHPVNLLCKLCKATLFVSQLRELLNATQLILRGC